MSEQAVTAQSEDFSRWYNEIVYRADLGRAVAGAWLRESSSPTDTKSGKASSRGWTAGFKATGHQNAYFPLFIPESYIRREAEHVEGFSPELAVVTHAGGKELEEPLVVRPTSETVVGEAFSDWIQSYREVCRF